MHDHVLPQALQTTLIQEAVKGCSTRYHVDRSWNDSDIFCPRVGKIKPFRLAREDEFSARVRKAAGIRL